MWVKGDNGGLDGRLTASTANAAAATPNGFVAVGSHGAAGRSGSRPRRPLDPDYVSAPSGARSATLNQVVTSGNTIVATGLVATRAGDSPLAVTSTDGGAHWREVALPTPGGLGVVTALTTADNRFLAAGQVGQAGAQHAVTWTSSDGLAGRPPSAAAGVKQITAPLRRQGHGNRQHPPGARDTPPS